MTSFSDVIVGGTDNDTMQNAVTLNRSTIPGATQISQADRFWATPTAFVGDPIEEVLELNFATSSITNLISFEAAHFPQSIRMEYSESTADNWLPILDPTTRQPLVINVFESVPAILTDPSTIIGHYHPQHDYEGHWNIYELPIAVANIQKLRFILQRTAGTGPLNVSGLAVPYSLGLQSIDTGYVIASEDDIPFSLDEADSSTSGQVFANTSDIFGSNLGFSKKAHKASNLVYNSDIDAPLIWKSEPQPRPEAVVNFYADLRDSTGAPQIIDQIFIDPLYLGCSVNLYYSNDDTSGLALSSRTGLTGTQAVLHGATISNNGPLNLGTWHPDATVVVYHDDGTTTNVDVPAHFDPYYVQFDNFYTGFDPSLDWWVGVEWTRNWSMTVDSLDHDIFSCDTFRFGQGQYLDESSAAQSLFYLSTSAGDTITLQAPTVDGVPIKIVASSSDGTLYLSIVQLDNVYTMQVPVTLALSSKLPGQFLLGTDTTRQNFLGGLITSFVLSQTAHGSDINDDLTVSPGSFLDNPTPYSAVPLMSGDEGQSKYGALIRFDTTQLSLTNTTGFIGGPLHPYDQMSWTPIPRDYEMQRGIMKLPATSAKFWNLEISNLRPENVEKYIPVTRQTKFFPPSLYSTTNTTSSTSRQSDADFGLNIQQSLATSNGFRDSPQYTGTGGSVSGLTNTQVYIATDNSAADRLAEVGNPWRYQQLHPVFNAPRFSQTGPHIYQVEQITQATNVSFFCGLRQIIFSRTISTAPQDLPVFTDSFLDGDGIGSGNWVQKPLGISSGVISGNSYAQTTSIVMPTQTGMRGLQFAAQQTDAIELDVSGEFSSPLYDQTKAATWTPVGDAKPFGMTYNKSIKEYAYLVSRQANFGYWIDVPLNYGPTYGQIETQFLRYSNLENPVIRSSDLGGLQSQSIAAPYNGRIYAAARVTAAQNLTEPLYVQILDADTGAVLSESQSNVSQNEVKQWYTSVELSDFAANIGQKWSDLRGIKTWPSFQDGFTRANSATLGKLDSGQTWTTITGYTPLTIASNFATSTSTTARSAVNTQTPYGTLSVRIHSVVTAGSLAAAVPLFDLGGMYLMNDKSFLNTNTSAPVGTLAEAISTSHDYNFKFMLTSQVPSGQVPAGVDATLQPYSLVISTGTLGSDTWLQTLSSSRNFTSIRSLQGANTTSFSKFAWVPSNVQVNQPNFFSHQFIPTSLSSDGNGIYDYTYQNKKFTYQGQYTYSTTNLAVAAASLFPSGSVATTPTSLAGTVSGSGGFFGSVDSFGNPYAPTGTYFYKVTGLTSLGESAGSTEISKTVSSTGSVALTWSGTGATSYNVYRGSSSGTETFLGSSTTASFTDVGNTSAATGTVPTYNTSNGAGTMQVADLVDQFGSFKINVTQMPSNMAAADVILAYLDYNPVGHQVLTLRGDGSIVNEITGSTLSTLSGFTPTAGPLTIHYVNTALLSSAFTTAHPQTNRSAILFFQNSTTYLGSYSTTGTYSWTSTIRGIGGANNGTSAGQYTIIEGFNWNADGDALAVNTSSTTWGNVDFNSTRTYNQMSLSGVGTTQNISIQVVQKNQTNDSWFIQAATIFWDPVKWEFSSDSGLTWWEASVIRNDPSGVLLFPPGLTSYTGLMWRLTSYAGRVSVSHLAIRPWYTGQHSYVVPPPPSLPQGPNVIPTDDYTIIEQDPRWMAWDNPIPHWWWIDGLATS